MKLQNLYDEISGKLASPFSQVMILKNMYIHENHIRMHLEIAIKYLHFIAIFGIIATVAVENILIQSSLTKKEIDRLARIDSLYGLSAILLLAAGFSLWFWVGKPAIVYSRNYIFILKIALLVIVALLSIYPTVFFNKKRKGDPEEKVDLPFFMIASIRIELFLLFIIPLLAVIMAKGIGYMG